MLHQRYWGLFVMAVAMAAHSAVVGRLLESSSFMLLFFWGWVAVAALKGRLDLARSMTLAMVAVLSATALTQALLPGSFPGSLAYYAFALYPALVSWVCAYIYIRHLSRKPEASMPLTGHAFRQQRMGSAAGEPA